MKKSQCCLVLFSFLLLVLTAAAQVQNGQFTGTVTDQTGAAVVGAKVTVTNVGTNLSVTTTTNQSGAYTAKEQDRYQPHAQCGKHPARRL